MNNFKGMYKTGVFFDTKIRNYISVKTEEEYKKLLKTMEAPIELVGGKDQQVKPYFDCDPSFPKNYIFDETMFCVKIGEEIRKMFPNKPVYYMKRQPREKDGKMRYSIRFVVGQVRITNKNIKEIIKQNGFSKTEPFDTQVYGNNQGLYSVYTNKKVDAKTSEIYEVPQLVPFDYFTKQEKTDINITDYWPSYIEEDYEDWDLKFAEHVEEKPASGPKSVSSEFDDEGSHEESSKYSNINLQEIITKLKPARADNYDDWINCMYCIMNCCDAQKLKKIKTFELVDLYASKSDNYDEHATLQFCEKNYDKRREKGYRFKFLLDMLKEDDPEYYRKHFTPAKKILSYREEKELFEKDHAKILYPVMYVYRPKDKNKKLELMSLKDLKTTYQHKRCIIIRQTPKGVDYEQEVSFITKWIEDANIKLYDYKEFIPPPLKSKDDTYNTWMPFSIFDIPYDKENTEYNKEVLDRFLGYGNGLLGEEVFKYCLAYFANRLQNPANRTKVSIILYGVEGDGKNMFFDIFKNIFGLKYFHELEKGKDLFKDHAYWEIGRLFILINEGDPKDMRGNSEVLKARITTDTINANPKGVNMFTEANYCDYLMTTNNDDAVSINDASRRYLICQSSCKYRGNDSFFVPFANAIVKNDRALRVIAEYLMNFNISEVIPTGNFQKHIPNTEIMKEVKESNMDYVERFMREKYESIVKFDGIPIDGLFSMWRGWCDTCNIDSRMDKPTFSKRLNKLIREKKWDFIRKNEDHHIRRYDIDKRKYKTFVGLDFQEDN